MSDAKNESTGASAPKKSSGGLARALILLAGAIVLFVAGLAGTLGMRGKLNAEYLGTLLGKAPESKEGDEPAADHAAALSPRKPVDGATAPSASHETSAGSRDSRSTSDSGSRKPAFASLSLPSPFSSEETTELFEELESKRAELRDKLASVERQQKDLDLVRADMSRRWDELNHREEQLEEREKSLVAERGELDSRSVHMKEAELSNFKKLAGDLEKMPAEAAAKVLEQSPPERVAQILVFVKPREAGKILAALTPTFAAQVSEKSLQIVKPAEAVGASEGD